MAVTTARHLMQAVAVGLLAVTFVVGAGCGGDAPEAEREAADAHAGHAHALEATDDHAGRDQGEGVHDEDGHADDEHDDHDRAEEASTEDDHDDHAHGEDGHAEGPVLSDRDREDAGIVLAEAGPGCIELRSRLLGEVRMNRERLAHVVPPAAGIIREVHVRAGDDVESGQLLAVIASRELAEARAAYLGARGRRELAQIDHDREKELWERNILAEQDYLDAKQALLEADIELQAAEQTLHALGTTDSELALLEQSHEAGALTRLELRAPISGTVTELHMVLGEVVGEDSDVLVIADLSTVWVEFDVPQSELGAVCEGRPVTVSASGADVPDAAGVIDFVSPIVDEVTRTALARVELSNPSGVWRPGLFVTASMERAHLDAHVIVPRDAVQLLDNEQVVFVPDGDGFRPVVVVLGSADSAHAEVVSGLASGQRYVAEGAFALKAEMITSGMDSHAGHGH